MPARPALASPKGRCGKAAPPSAMSPVRRLEAGPQLFRAQSRAARLPPKPGARPAAPRPKRVRDGPDIGLSFARPGSEGRRSWPRCGPVLMPGSPGRSGVRIEWRARAREDALAVADHIDLDSPAAAITALEEIHEQVALLARHPRMGRPGRVRDSRDRRCIRASSACLHPRSRSSRPSSWHAWSTGRRRSRQALPGWRSGRSAHARAQHPGDSLPSRRPCRP